VPHLPALTHLQFITEIRSGEERAAAANSILQPDVFLRHSALLVMFVGWYYPSRVEDDEEYESEKTSADRLANRDRETSISIRSYSSYDATRPVTTIQILRKRREQRHLWPYNENSWDKRRDGADPDLPGSVRSTYAAPKLNHNLWRRFLRWSDVLVFDGVLVDVVTARRVLSVLGHLDNPDFQAQRGIPLSEGFWTSFDEE
jgi:hypothetical protein